MLRTAKDLFPEIETTQKDIYWTPEMTNIIKIERTFYLKRKQEGLMIIFSYFSGHIQKVKFRIKSSCE